LFHTQGKSGVTPIARFDTTDYSTRFAGEIKDLDVEGYINKKNARRLDDTIKYILVSGKQVPSPPTSIPTPTHLFQSTLSAWLQCREGIRRQIIGCGL